MSLDCLVINRARDVARLERFRARARVCGWAVRRIAALDAHRPGFPFFAFGALIGPHFWGEDEIKPGALGCFLSHRRAWEEVLRGEAPQALICEDDTVLGEGPERLEAAAAGLGEFDILHANDRMADWAGDAGPVAALPGAVARIAASGTPPKRAPGADCYLLTRRGAARLLEITARERITCGVDWAMVLAGADTAALSADQISSWSELAVLTERAGTGPAEIAAHVLAEPVGVQKGGVPSVLGHGISLPIAGLTGDAAEALKVREIVTIRRGAARFAFAITAPNDPMQAALAVGEIPGEAALSALIRAFPEGGTLIDAGAGPGVAGVVVARGGGAARVIAAEPDPASARLVALNMEINGLGDVLDAVGLSLGLGASEGWARLAGPERRPSRRRLRPMEADSTEEPIAVTTGAALAGDAGVDALMVDVGGGEFEVLRGFAKLFRRARPAVLVTMPEGRSERIGEFLARFGYGAPEIFPAAAEGRVSGLWR